MKKIIYLIFIVILSSVTSPGYGTNPKSQPYKYHDNSLNWVMVPELSDEFNKESINSNKWDSHYPYWKGRPPSWFMGENVTVSGGNLQITMKTKTDTTQKMGKGIKFSCGILRSKTPFLYGYTEVRAKAMSSAGSSAFWLNNSTENWWTEIDVFEIGGNAKGHEYSVHTNVHEFYTPNTPKNQYTPYDDKSASHFNQPITEKTKWRPDSSFHVYGVEWNEENIIWYIDGEEIRRFKHKGRWSQELFINIDSEVMEGWWGLPAKEDLPSYYLVDYVRTWQLKL